MMHICKLWNLEIKSNLKSDLIKDLFSIRDSDELEEELKDHIMTENSVVHCKLFHRTESRLDNTQFADFLHGHSLCFQDFVHSYLKVDKRIHFSSCLECSTLADSSYHKIFECSNINEISLRNTLSNSIGKLGTNFHLPIIFGEPVPSVKDLLENPQLCLQTSINNITIFKKLVKYVCDNSNFGDTLLTN